MEKHTHDKRSRVSHTLTLEMPAHLPANTVGLIKLPVPITQITALCEMFPGPDMHIHQDGAWMVVTKGGKAS